MFNIPELFIEKEIDKKHFTTKAVFYENNQGTERSKVAISSFLISFLLSGKKQINHLNYAATIAKNEFLLLKPGHCLMTERVPLDSSYQALLYFFDATVFGHMEFLRNKKAAQNPANKDFLVLPADEYVRNFIQSIRYLNQKGYTLTDGILTVKLEEILFYLTDKHGQTVTDFLLSGISSPDELKIRQIAENNIERKLTVEELAFLCHMSVSTFNRKFKEIYALSPSRWFHKQRLLKARNLIMQYHKSPGEIYEEAGFENFSSFSQAFKKEFGELPSQLFSAEH